MTHEDKLYGLIENKDFKDLSADEKDFVLQHINEENYLLQRSIVVESEALFEEEKQLLVPSLESKHAAISQMKRQEEEENDLPWFLAIFTQKIPAYSLVIPLLLLGFLVLTGWFQKQPANITVLAPEKGESIKTVTLYDTVFLEKEVPVETVREVVHVVEKPVQVKANYGIVVASDYIAENSAHFQDIPMTVDSASKILDNQLKNISQSAQDRPELKQFSVSVP